MFKPIAFIMCIWKRIERLRHTLNLLDAQTDKDFVLYLWNNNSEIINTVNEIVKEFSSKIQINVIHSNNNVGGIGRFYYSREIMKLHDAIVFIDDDQDFNVNMVSKFRLAYDEDSIKSRWAFRYDGFYSNRERAYGDNEIVNYCGTGGMVLPSKVFSCDLLYQIPEKYKFIEDLWLSYVGRDVLNLKLRSIGSPDEFINQIVDGKDQSNMEMLYLKNEFSLYLKNEKKYI